MNLPFSNQPGAYERHIQRKYNNPLFPTAAQHYMPEEVELARQKDRQALERYMQIFSQTVERAAKLDSHVDSDVVLDLKNELEKLYIQSCSLMGDLEKVRAALLQLLNVCMNVIKRSSEDDPVAQKKLQDEIEARRYYFGLLETPLVADLVGQDDLIAEDDLIPCLLSTSVQELETVLQLFEAEQCAALADQAEKFLATLSDLPDKQTYMSRIAAMRTCAIQNRDD